MYQKILVPMALDHDVSPMTLKAAKLLGAPGADITALHVHEAPQGSAGVFLDEEIVSAGYEQSKGLFQDKLKDADGVKSVMIKGHTARSIIDFAEKNDIDCIVMGSHKPGLIDYFLGSTAAWVVRHAKCAVHVHREHG